MSSVGAAAVASWSGRTVGAGADETRHLLLLSLIVASGLPAERVPTELRHVSGRSAADPNVNDYRASCNARFP